jgi:hypothetical protein
MRYILGSKVFATRGQDDLNVGIVARDVEKNKIK